jgi:LysR family glycine cleavage system transcriptional activator
MKVTVLVDRLPPLNPLRAFEATARLGSLTRAAAELNVTHGAVSHQIRALETALGIRLFERVGRRLRPTPHAADLLATVSGAFAGIAAATARLRRPSNAGSLVVSCVPALLSFWLLPRLGSFLARYPDIRLRLIASNDPNDVRSAEIDLCIHYGQSDWTGCWFRKWSDLDLFPVISPTLANSRPLRSARDLADHLLLHGDDGTEWRTWLAAADALDLAQGPQLHMSDARLSTESALLGHGVALGDTVTAGGLLARGQLLAPIGISVPAVHSFHLVCRAELRSAPVVQLFADWLFAERDAVSARDVVAGPGQMRRRRAAGAAD